MQYVSPPPNNNKNAPPPSNPNPNPTPPKAVQNNVEIGERKNMNLPGVSVDLPVLQPTAFHETRMED